MSNSQFPIPNSQFPIPNSQFPIPNSQFPILNKLKIKVDIRLTSLRSQHPDNI
ncbi:MAG: hypothetical protein F6K31_23390 [Symploca sp. SIO2G7]|nr:hypothetical protein [Symploca sp. SIO2G7]